jgi:hypothetical protein
MAEYRVILKGIADESQEGRGAFYQRFGNSYGMSPDQARDWIERHGGRIYVFNDQAAAIKARDFLLGLGAIAEVVEQGAQVPEQVPAPAAPGPEAPASGRSCPKCGAWVPAGRDDCPTCQVFISKYEQMMARRAAATATGAAGPGSGESQTWQGQPGGGYYNSTPPSGRTGQGWRLGYLRPYNLGDMFGDVIDLYKDNFMTLFLLQLIPLGALVAVVIVMAILGMAMGLSSGGEEHMAAIIVFMVLVGVPVFIMLIYISAHFYTATVFAITEAMHGGRPEWVRSLKSVRWPVPVKLVITELMLGLALFVPFVLITLAMGSLGAIGIAVDLLLLPLFIGVAGVFLLVFPAVVVEDTWGLTAFSRSIELGKGHYWRNLGVFAVFMIAIMVIMIIASLVLAIIPIIGGLAAQVVQAALAPILIIVMVILYYEMRVRKEGYPGHAAAMTPPAPAQPAPAYYPPPSGAVP